MWEKPLLTAHKACNHAVFNKLPMNQAKIISLIINDLKSH
jgi:hypothetical protein